MKDKIFAPILKVSNIDADLREIEAIISTATVDRDNEVLLPKGANVEQFLKNPVVLWAHDSHQPPIGRALWVKVGRKKVTAKLKFAETERAEEVWQLFKGGFLSAFSVGFIPKEGRQPTPEDIRKNPDLADARFIFTEWELLEFSAVPVPANPEALATAIKSKALELDEELIKQFHIPDEIDNREEVDSEVPEEETEQEKTTPLEIELPEVEVELAPVEIKSVIDIQAVAGEQAVEALKKHRGEVYKSLE